MTERTEIRQLTAATERIAFTPKRAQNEFNDRSEAKIRKTLHLQILAYKKIPVDPSLPAVKLYGFPSAFLPFRNIHVFWQIHEVFFLFLVMETFALKRHARLVYARLPKCQSAALLQIRNRPIPKDAGISCLLEHDALTSGQKGTTTSLLKNHVKKGKLSVFSEIGYTPSKRDWISCLYNSDNQAGRHVLDLMRLQSSTPTRIDADIVSAVIEHTLYPVKGTCLALLLGYHRRIHRIARLVRENGTGVTNELLGVLLQACVATGRLHEALEILDDAR